jgi:hypothetical protein
MMTTFAALLAVSIIASLLSLPFTKRVQAQQKGNTAIVSESVLWAAALSVELVGSAIAIGSGMTFGTRIGIGMPLVARWSATSIGFVAGGATGVVIGILRIALKRLTPSASAATVQPTTVERVLVSVAAGIREELWFRFGLMTFLIWLLVTTTGVAASNWA